MTKAWKKNKIRLGWEKANKRKWSKEEVRIRHVCVLISINRWHRCHPVEHNGTPNLISNHITDASYYATYFVSISIDLLYAPYDITSFLSIPSLAPSVSIPLFRRSTFRVEFSVPFSLTFSWKMHTNAKWRRSENLLWALFCSCCRHTAAFDKV